MDSLMRKFNEIICSIGQAGQCTSLLLISTPKGIDYCETIREVRARFINLAPADELWAKRWEVCLNIGRVLGLYSREQLETLYSITLHKTWVMAFFLSQKFVFEIAPLYSTYLIHSLQVILETVSLPPHLPPDFLLNFREIPETVDLQELFTNVANYVFRRFSLKVSLEHSSRVAELYMRAFFESTATYTSPAKYAADIGLSNAEMIQAMRCPEAFANFGLTRLKKVFDTYKQTR